MATLNEKQARLFTNRNWGVIATIREDGSPQATPVWIDYDGENVLVNSARGRTKVKNIERDPRATVTVLPAEDQQSGYVMVSGPATIVEEGALEHINTLAKKYLGEDKYPYLGPGEQRVIIQIQPERVDGFGAGGQSSVRTLCRMRLFAATGDGIARFDETGEAWTVELSLSRSGVQCLAVDPADSDVVYAGLGEGGVRRSVDGGGSWQDCGLPEPGVFSLAVSAADGAVYAGTEPSRLFRSDDRGGS